MRPFTLPVPQPLPLALASSILRRALMASTMLALLGGTALAQSTAPVSVLTITPAHRTPQTVVAAAESTPILKRLPASQSELTFRGESASRTWSVMLGRSEAARTATFQLSLLNAISVLPDRSALKVTINGAVLATIPADATEKPANVAIKIPTGVLVPGANIVQISAALTHRVDCSVKATYELWASLAPLTTGFLVPREVAAGATSLDDLAVEPLAEDGTTRIHLRMDDGAAAEDIGHAGRFIDALARRAGLPRPVVDVGPDLGKGAGFDVVIDKGDRIEAARSLKIVANAEGVAIGRDAASNRLVLMLSGADDATLDRTIAALAQNRQARGEAPLAGSVSRSFADFGFATDNFAGRHYMSSLDVNLPADFYPANDRARLLLDGGHSAALAEGSTLVFRVNGTLISSLPLTSGVAERFEHEVVELPLRFFHPGHNDISIEGMTSAAADQQCDLATMPHDARLTIANTSRFEMPGFAHLATLPQIQTALAYDSAPDGGPIHLYLSDADRGSMGAGLTFLANMAATQERIGTPVVHLGDPSVDDAPGLVIAAADRLPEALSTALANLSAPVDAKAGAGAPAQDAVAAAAPSDVFLAAAAGGEQTAALKVNTVVGAAEAMLRSRGFFFATDGRADLLPATHSSMLIAAVAPDTASTAIGGIELPRFLRDPAHWLVVTAPDAATTEAGIRRLVANGQWSQLGGRAVSLDLSTDELRTIQPNRFAYVWPNSVVLSDVRPIFGGVVSHNIVLSIGLLMLLMSILGVSTHVLVRRMGVK